MQAEDAEQVAAAAASLGRRFSVADIAATSDLPVPKLLAVLRAPTSVPVTEPGVMMGFEFNTLAMQGLSWRRPQMPLRGDAAPEGRRAPGFAG